ncbi:MAG: PEGA domain-containing protein [Planctomycetes bacterium]|nr:PEGA domain-containing protein [Planctomycetota bacterium]
MNKITLECPIRTASRLLPAIFAMAAPACVSIKSDPKLFVFSEPDGANVYVDGVDSGFTTPAALEPGSSTITIQKDGYKPVVRSVRRDVRFRYPRWNDGGSGDFSIALSLTRTADDFFFPLQWSTKSSPNRIFVVLQPLDAAPPGPK